MVSGRRRPTPVEQLLLRERDKWYRDAMRKLTPRPVSTFSIVVRDPETGDLGIATASKFLAVGAVVPYAAAGVGAVATQAHANTSFGPRAIAGLRSNIPLAQIHAAFEATDHDHPVRQYGMVDAGGNSLSFTGNECLDWAGGRKGEGYAVQGNLLAGPQVVEEAVAGYEMAHDQRFPERLLAALRAGDEAGGDRRGRQSAALLVVRENGGYGGFNDRLIDLRADDHDRPVGELERLLDIHRLYFDPPREEDVLAIEGDVLVRVQDVLVRSGYLSAARQVWDEESATALGRLAGTENLEERLFDDARIDRIALEYLEGKAGA